MFDGSELEIAIAMVLAGAICLGFVLHWLWSVLGGAKTDSARLDEMAEQLHEAALARETAQTARQEAEAALVRREAEIAEQMAAMQARTECAVEGREAQLQRELSEARMELETLREDLGNARRRVTELEAQSEALSRSEN